jgi:branched-chain amino acid transport system substrate-binding protein
MQQIRRSRGSRTRVACAVGAAAVALVAAGCGSNNNKSDNAKTSTSTQTASAPAPSNGKAIKIGVLTTCGGPFALFEQESLSGAKYALIKYAGGKAAGTGPQDQVNNATVAGKPVQIAFGCSDATPDKAVAEARRLVENVGVKILLGPLSGDEGIAVANYAKTQSGVTFVNGTSGAQATTLTVKAPNFFRFGGDGAQWMAGLGTYAFKALHWHKAAIIGEDYSYPYTQAAGFVSEFCALGGNVTARVWAPLTTTDWSSYVSKLPRDVDGVLFLTGGTNTINVLKSYTQTGGKVEGHALGGSSVMDPTAFAVGNQMAGLAGGSPVPLGGSAAGWSSYVSGMNSAYPKAPADSLFTVLYYNGMQAIIEALKETKGKVGAPLQSALGKLKPTFPNGSVTLDANRNSIEPAYVEQVVDNGGKLGFKDIKTIPSVKQDFGGLFSASSPAPSRTAPACKKGPSPPWSNAF